MKHPFQILVSDKKGEYIFGSVKNHLVVFRTSDGSLVGSWVDTVDAQTFQDEKFKARRAEQLRKEEEAEKASTEGKNSESVEQPAKKPKKEHKVPVPGPGAPKIYNYIRSLTLTRNEKFIIGTTDSDKAAVVFSIDHSKENCLQLIKRQIYPKRPCAVSTTIDDKEFVLADKFGDVYNTSIENPEVIAEKEMVPILGHVSMLSDVLVTEHNGKQYILTGDRDEHVKVTHYPKSYVVKHWLFGHREFVSLLHICSFDNEVLISGGGDDYLVLWNWWQNKQLARVELRELIAPFLTDGHLPPERFLEDDSPREISITKVATLTRNGKNLLVVLCENTKSLLIFTVDNDFDVQHSQTFVSEHPIVDFVIVGDSIISAIDIESDDNLLEYYSFDAENTLVKQDHEITKAITSSVTCTVSSRSEFYPLYYIHSLRKRSEH